MFNVFIALSWFNPGIQDHFLGSHSLVSDHSCFYPRNTFSNKGMFHINKANFIVWLSCNMLQLASTNSIQVSCFALYFHVLSILQRLQFLQLAVCEFVSLWVRGPESSVWLLGFVDIRSGVALLGSVAQRSLFRWIPLTSLTYNWIALLLRFACRIETLPGPHRRVLFKTGAICRPLFRHQSGISPL